MVQKISFGFASSSLEIPVQSSSMITCLPIEAVHRLLLGLLLFTRLGDLIQSHRLNTMYISGIPEFISLAQTSLLDTRHEYPAAPLPSLFRCLFDVSDQRVLK